MGRAVAELLRKKGKVQKNLDEVSHKLLKCEGFKNSILCCFSHEILLEVFKVVMRKKSF